MPMTRTREGRPLRITAILLILTALALILALLLTRAADGSVLDEALLSARFAVEKGDFSPARRELLRASRHALSSAHWREILRLAAALIPPEAEPSDYRLFAVLAGRAAAALPGNEDLTAYMVWGVLRTGRTSRALGYAEALRSPRWSSLRAEVRLAALSEEDSRRLQSLSGGNILAMDGEYLEYAASLTESAELSVNAALLYMLRGESGRASALAEEVMAGNRRWYDPETPVRRGIPGALGRIAYDAGDFRTAASWIQSAVDDARRRRGVNWRDLQLLGDIYWEMYTLQGRSAHREAAADAWYGAKLIALPSEVNPSPPEDSWKILINLASAEAASNSSRRADELLTEALTRFPERSEVKAAWARANMHRNPAMARRMVVNPAQAPGTPPAAQPPRQPTRQAPGASQAAQTAVLGIAALQINPEALTPRRYSARLWELFQIAVQTPPVISPADARIIAAALLEYLASIEDYASVDAAAARYLRAYPRDHWVLAWRLAADSSLGTALINLIAENPETESSYSAFRSLVRNTRSPRGLHDAALFAAAAADELKQLARTIPESPLSGPAPSPSPGSAPALRPMPGSASSSAPSPASSAAIYADAAILSSPAVRAHPSRERIALLEKNRAALAKITRELGSPRSTGSAARAAAKAAILTRIDTLYSNALEDLALAAGASDEIPPKDRAALLYLQARILSDTGRREDAALLAARALDIDPFNMRARELLITGAGDSP